jgi:hypothetical protein
MTMKGQWKKVAVIAIVLSFVAVGCGSNAAPTSPPTQPPPTLAPPTATPIPPEQIVTAAMQGWDRESVDASQVEATLAYFTDDAAFKMVGFPPEIPADFSSKAAIRQAYESWLPLHPRLQVKIQKTEGDKVIATTSYWSDPTRAMGVAPLVGTDVYVVKNGKIMQETWTLTDQSRQAFAAAMAQAAAPKPTATPAANPYVLKLQGAYEMTITKDENSKYAGKWRMVISPRDTGGSMRVAWNGNTVGTEPFTVTQDTLMFPPDDLCPGPGAYKWALDGKALTFTKVADDCMDRSTVTPLHPWIKQD